MLDSKKIVKVVSVVVASISMMGVGASVSEAASFTAPKLGVSEVLLLTHQSKRVTRFSFQNNK